MKGSKNIIYSPLSIQTCLTMARMGAEGSTASEMDQYLGYTGKSLESTAEQFQKLLSKYEKSNILNMANKVYVMKGYELQDTYNELLSDKFYSPAENVDFGENTKAAETMNNWVETKTNNAINNLIDPDNVDGSTRLFLLSAIHFKGNWKLRFDAKLTREDDFYIDATHSVKVPMMYRSGMTDFGWDSELKAGVLRLPYENTDLSMVIVLPQERDGLSAVLEKLKGIPLKSLTKGLTSSRELILYLPKFKAEFDIELNDVLKKVRTVTN